jgi:phenylalanyl-tRNA synthetase beta subunit
MQRYLGMTITDNAIVKVLDQYGYSYEKSEEFYTMAVPLWRHDIVGTHDMAEEIGRVTGYDTIPSTPLPFAPTIIANDQYEKIRAIKSSLSQQGYSEVMTYSFRKKGEVYIAHGPKDKSALRANLSDALKESYDMNRLNAPLLGLNEVKIFEIGTVFASDKEQINVATADKSGVKEWSVDEYVLPAGMPPASAKSYGAAKAVAPFKPWSPYPFITRDIAIWLDNAELAETLQKIISEFAEQHCARPATLFDTFTKQDPSNPSGYTTSMAYRFVFQSMEKTLTDKEVETVFQELVTTISGHTGMTIR